MNAASADGSDIVSRLRLAGCVFAEDEARLLIAEARTPDELDAMVKRRIAGLALEHILGWAEFSGLRINVDPGVFVPRRRSEFLVAQAVALALPGAVILDLCCGSGAIGAALASQVDAAEVHAVDIDPAAIACAGRNLAAFGGHAYEGDIDGPLPARLRGRVDLVVANAPYVPSSEVDLLPSEARLHEPRVALDGGADGLDVQRRVIAAAPRWLARDGHLLVETSEHQTPRTVEAFVAGGLSARVASSEEFQATVVIGSTVRGAPPPNPRSRNAR